LASIFKTTVPHQSKAGSLVDHPLLVHATLHTAAPATTAADAIITWIPHSPIQLASRSVGTPGSVVPTAATSSRTGTMPGRHRPTVLAVRLQHCCLLAAVRGCSPGAPPWWTTALVGAINSCLLPVCNTLGCCSAAALGYHYKLWWWWWQGLILVWLAVPVSWCVLDWTSPHVALSGFLPWCAGHAYNVAS